ncbi:hypothetical protein BCR34DRAFT_594899 [Clohesyomyces aquaticus]|uniref:Fucose-specific lectin n=1 Tax=Clohesyomyces aquaticus TaxID=1231657 RepID=A0A1Y1Y367_9PLEO|nr:hypothetical protein BCR34DRAFT_594899 [Clohesyomyces aquaticus]
MHFPTSLSLLSLLTTALLLPSSLAQTQVQIPTNSRTTVIQPYAGNVRIYYQSDNYKSINEVHIDAATGVWLRFDEHPVETKANTSIYGITYDDSGYLKIKVYYVTPWNTLGELSYGGNPSSWNTGTDLGFSVSKTARQINAIRADGVTQVAFTDVNGNLRQACNSGSGWTTRLVSK